MFKAKLHSAETTEEQVSITRFDPNAWCNSIPLYAPCWLHTVQVSTRRNPAKIHVLFSILQLVTHEHKELRLSIKYKQKASSKRVNYQILKCKQALSLTSCHP